MSFIVREIDGLPKSPPATVLRSVRYPPKEITGVVTTRIDLWEVDASRVFSVNRRKDYKLILHQTDPQTTATISFLLHTTNDFDLSQDAYDKVHKTIDPLVDDCTLLLTKKLLKEIILPTPKNASELSHHLAEVIETNPGAHSDWVKVLQALVLAAIGREDDDDEQAIEILMSKCHADVDVRVADRRGNTVLHRAKSRKSIQFVIEKATEKLSDDEKKKLLCQSNEEGKAPLHYAFQQNNAEVVCELIQAGADFNTLTQDEDGSNPFHVAAESGSAESIGAAYHKKDNFLQKDSSDNPEKQRFVLSLNTLNKKGYTPLMLSVSKGYVNSSVAFLQAGADPNVQHPDSGDTVLHYAAEGGNAVLLKTLIAFGANIETHNNTGKVPLDVARTSKAEGAKECVDILEETTKAMEEASFQISGKFEPISVPSNSIFLLSLDGGGSRGLLSTQTLIAIHKRMKELKPVCKPLHKYFDYIAGTSTGGLVALSMVSVGASLEATRVSQFKAVDELMTLPPTIPFKVIRKFFHQIIGKDVVMTDTQKPRVIVPTVQADCKPSVLHLMCNYGEARNGQKPPKEWKVWEACVATSAAPVYFPPFEKKFIDGGMMANNPTLDAMAEIITQAEKEESDAKLALVVSIGTGVMPHVEVEDVGIVVPNHTNAFKAIAKLPQTFSAVQNFRDLVIAQATLSDGQETARASAWCKSLGIPYYRLSVPLSKAINLAESKMETLIDMMYQGHLYLVHNAKQVDAIARYLLSR